MKKELNNSMSNVTTLLTRREGQGGGSVRPKKFWMLVLIFQCLKWDQVWAL